MTDGYSSFNSSNNNFLNTFNIANSEELIQLHTSSNLKMKKYSKEFINRHVTNNARFDKFGVIDIPHCDGQHN